MSFSKNLKKLREEKNLSQKDLADIFNFSRSTISNYEKNKRLPDIDVICQLAQFFNVSTDYLIGRTNFKNSFYHQIRYDKSVIAFIINPGDASFIDCNLSAVKFFGYPKNVLLTMKVYETTVEPEEKVMNYIREALQKEQKIFITQHITAKGIAKDVKVTINPFTVEDKTLLYCVLNDLSSYLNENRYLFNALTELVEVTGQLSHKKFHYKKDHQKRVAKIAVAIARNMGLAKERLNTLEVSGLLHDLGEIQIPDEIMNKPDRLSIAEYNLVKKHPEHAYNLLKNIKYLKSVGRIILQHHERLDGSGYPAALKGKQIMMEARILAIADVIEALTSERPYRSAFSIESALELLAESKGEKYDPDVVDSCIEVYTRDNFTF